MNIAEFFKTVAPKLGLSESEISQIIEQDAIPEEKKTIFDAAKSLLTQDAAIGDPNIRNKVLGRTLDEIDNTILDTFRSKYGDRIDPEQFDKLQKSKRTSDKVIGLIDMLSTSYSGELDKLKESGNVSKELRDQLDSLRGALTKEKEMAAQLQKQIQEQQAKYEEQRLMDRMKSYLTRKKFKTDDPDIQEFFINEKIIKPAMSQAKFVFDDSGKIEVRNHADPNLKKYVGDDQTNPVTFETFLDYLGKDLYAKNDVDPGKTRGKDTRTIDPEVAKKMPPHMLEALQKNQKNL